MEFVDFLKNPDKLMIIIIYYILYNIVYIYIYISGGGGGIRRLPQEPRQVQKPRRQDPQGAPRLLIIIAPIINNSSS